jgi:hypothetical protein
LSFDTREFVIGACPSFLFSELLIKNLNPWILPLVRTRKLEGCAFLGLVKKKLLPHLRAHHALLGLQLDLQGIDSASQLHDLCLAGLQLL